MGVFEQELSEESEGLLVPLSIVVLRVLTGGDGGYHGHMIDVGRVLAVHHALRQGLRDEPRNWENHLCYPTALLLWLRHPDVLPALSQEVGDRLRKERRGHPA